jgi:hypothetical protein
MGHKGYKVLPASWAYSSLDSQGLFCMCVWGGGAGQSLVGEGKQGVDRVDM